ncbi:hypothetical protein ACFWU5_07790 [Nocardia sp. NPDC058640]|uniref:hypothetical protein n=1 Tax=Nocardia sp. NPDC058640 TaxID=3346571 RepID=UPI003657C117
MPPPPPHQGGKPPGQGGQVAAMALAGAMAFIVVNAIAGFFVLMVASSINDNTVSKVLFGLMAVASAASAFIGGWLLIRRKKAAPKGFGLGLMIGWSLVTVFTAGLCTALNPELYTGVLGIGIGL